MSIGRIMYSKMPTKPKLSHFFLDLDCQVLDFYPTLGCLDTQNVLHKYHHPSKPKKISCLDGLTKPLSLGRHSLERYPVIRWSVSIIEALSGGTSRPSISHSAQWAGAHVFTIKFRVVVFETRVRSLSECAWAYL